MITTKTKKGTKVYVTSTEDCDENEGGLYCQIYADSELENELDDFCIHKDELENNTFERIAKEYVNGITEY